MLLGFRNVLYKIYNMYIYKRFLRVFELFSEQLYVDRRASARCVALND